MEPPGSPMDWEDDNGNSWEAVPSPLLNCLEHTGVNVTSIYNPDELLDNCFFVTAAYLLGTDARTLAENLGVKAKAVTLNDIVSLLVGQNTPVRGVRFRRGTLASRGQHLPSRRGITEARMGYLGTEWPRKVGVGYRRPNGTCHVVVLEGPGTPYRRYIDYQIKSSGKDVTTEVSKAEICMLFAFV